jgi:hypothetical protein
MVPSILEMVLADTTTLLLGGPEYSLEKGLAFGRFDHSWWGQEWGPGDTWRGQEPRRSFHRFGRFRAAAQQAASLHARSHGSCSRIWSFCRGVAAPSQAQASIAPIPRTELRTPVLFCVGSVTRGVLVKIRSRSVARRISTALDPTLRWSESGRSLMAVVVWRGDSRGLCPRVAPPSRFQFRPPGGAQSGDSTRSSGSNGRWGQRLNMFEPKKEF